MALGVSRVMDNDDRIARPAQGQFFPMTVAETVRLIHDLRFGVPMYRKRLDIRFENPDKASVHGSDVAAFFPGDKIVIYSFPEGFDGVQAKAILKRALGALAKPGKDAKPTDRRRKTVSFRAYFVPPAKLIFTKRTRRATLGRYRMGDKFSHAFKPRGVKTDEQIVDLLDIT